MNELENIVKARLTVRQISSESCLIYSQLCGTQAESAAAEVLEGQLRMSSKLAKMESLLKKKGGLRRLWSIFVEMYIELIVRYLDIFSVESILYIRQQSIAKLPVILRLYPHPQ